MGLGYLVVIVVGGVVELLEVRFGNFMLMLKYRKGFVKLVLCLGYVFVFNFG